jgi:hypothetical protein
VRFRGGFGENSVFDVVFLWLICGGLVVKRGALTDAFPVLKNTPHF